MSGFTLLVIILCMNVAFIIFYFYVEISKRKQASLYLPENKVIQVDDEVILKYKREWHSLNDDLETYSALYWFIITNFDSSNKLRMLLINTVSNVYQQYPKRASNKIYLEAFKRLKIVDDDLNFTGPIEILIAFIEMF